MLFDPSPYSFTAELLFSAAMGISPDAASANTGDGERVVVVLGNLPF